jgi:hypothetical protein
VSRRPFPRHQASTRFLRVPAEDWARVRIGEKTEFRTRPRERSNITTCALPTPVVAYTTRRSGDVDPFSTKLMVLLERRYEPLFNIAEDPGALEREGFESYAHFRSYWKARNGGKYVPMQRVYVWRVREFVENDTYVLGTELLRELYGEHLQAAA